LIAKLTFSPAATETTFDKPRGTSVSPKKLPPQARTAPSGKRIPLELGFSQSELSQLLGASRPKVNAAMASLEKTGAMRRTFDRLFCDPKKLARIARSGDDA